MSGEGTSPYGRAPYGYGESSVAPTTTGSIFRNTYTGDTLAGRAIDPASGDWAMDSYGRVTGWTPGQQGIYLAMKTELGSSAVASLGNKMSSIKVIGDGLSRQVENIVTLALQPLVTQGIIDRVSVETKRSTSVSFRAMVSIKWHDLSTDQEQEATLG